MFPQYYRGSSPRMIDAISGKSYHQSQMFEHKGNEIHLCLLDHLQRNLPVLRSNACSLIASSLLPALQFHAINRKTQSATTARIIILIGDIQTLSVAVYYHFLGYSKNDVFLMKFSATANIVIQLKQKALPRSREHSRTSSSGSGCR